MDENQKLVNEKKVDEKTVAIGTYSVQFGDLSNLDALVEEAKEVLMKNHGISVEHFAEMKKIIARIKKSPISKTN